MSDDSSHPAKLVGLTAEIVASYLTNNPVQTAEIGSLIGDVHAALIRLAAPDPVEDSDPPKPAVPIKKSVQPDYLICLNDGKRFRSLKRHLKSKYGMTPDDYRAYWGLPADYPMVAPGYARERSQLAKAMGLGQQRRRRSA